jgi:hypothetical protein
LGNFDIRKFIKVSAGKIKFTIERSTGSVILNIPHPRTICSSHSAVNPLAPTWTIPLESGATLNMV